VESREKRGTKRGREYTNHKGGGTRTNDLKRLIARGRHAEKKETLRHQSDEPLKRLRERGGESVINAALKGDRSFLD